MNNDDFVPVKNFSDPLNHKSEEVEYSPKFINGSIFDIKFVEKEREISAQHKTIAFDLDETIRGWDDDKNQGFLRDHLKRILSSLRNHGYRLVIWTASNRPSVQQTLNKYPNFENYFDHIISAESYSFPLQTDENKENLHHLDDKYYEVLNRTMNNRLDPHSGRMIYRPAKDIKFLGYKVLIDDDPQAVEEAKELGFRCLRVFPYKYENPRGTDIPEDLIKIIEQDFERHMVNRIVNAAEGLAPEKETMYLIED